MTPPPPPPAPAAADDWRTLLEVSLTGIQLLRPRYAPATTELVDFTLEYLNPAAQRLTGLAEQPGGTVLECFPAAVAPGLVAYYRRAFEAGEPASYEAPYPADGLARQLRFAARRSGEQLLVSFTAAADLPAAPPEHPAAIPTSPAGTGLHHAEWEQLFAQAPAAMALFRGPQYVIEVVNDQHLALWGRRRAQVLGRPLFEAIPEAVGQGYEALLAGVLQTGQPYVARESHARLQRHGRAEDVYFHFVYQPVRAPDGRPSGVLVVATEVTELVVARQQLEQLNQALEARVAERTREAQAARAAAEAQRQHLHHVLTQLPAEVTTHRGPDHVFELVSPTYQRLFGGRAVQGRPARQVLPELENQPFFALLDRVYQTGEPYYGREVPAQGNYRNEGPPELRYFDLSYQALRDTQGQIEGVLSFAYDVTDKVQSRQRAEALQTELLAAAEHRGQERETQQQQLAELFEQAPVAIAVFRGPQYVIELANPAVCALWGRTPAQTLGTPLFELLPEAAGQGFEQLLDEVMASGQPYVAYELPSFIDREGRRDTVYWNFVYQPLREGAGPATGVTVVAAEVTGQVLARQQVQQLYEALQRSNAELQASNQQLTRTNADLDNFIYTASHDLWSPISNIEGLLLALQHDLALPPGAANIPELLALMQDTVDRFKRTIRDLTDVARLQKANAPLATTVDLTHLIDEVRQDLAPQFAAAGGTLTVEVGACPTLHFAEKNLRSIVYNLLSNGLKYRHPNRVLRLTIRCYVTASAHVLTVQDNGLGLDVRQQDKVFGLFQRLHDHVEGTGLGLYMVKKIMENAGGTIEVESELGTGSSFLVYFPLEAVA